MSGNFVLEEDLESRFTVLPLIKEGNDRSWYFSSICKSSSHEYMLSDSVGNQVKVSPWFFRSKLKPLIGGLRLLDTTTGEFKLRRFRRSSNFVVEKV